MSGGDSLVIQHDAHGITVETTDLEGEPVVGRFSEVRLLTNGWAVCVDPEAEPGRTDFFPPRVVERITVRDEDNSLTDIHFG